MGDAELIFEYLINSFDEAIKAFSTSKTEWEVDEHKGYIVKYEVSEKDLKAEFRVLLVGQIQYQFMYVATNPNFDEKVAEKFFKSFKLKK